MSGSWNLGDQIKKSTLRYRIAATSKISTINSSYHSPLMSQRGRPRETTTGDEAIPSGNDLGLLWDTLFGARVEFIHRSAIVFLVEAEVGKTIIRSDDAPASEIRSRLIQSLLVRRLIFQFPWYGGIQSPTRAFFLSINNILPDDMQQRLQILIGDIHERMLTRAPVMEHIITQLGLQIRDGKFNASHYKCLCDFASSILANNLTYDPSHPYASYCVSKCPVAERSPSGRTLAVVPHIHEACLLTVAKYESGSAADVLQDVNWPVKVPRIQVPRHTGVSSDKLQNLIFTHLVLTSWILIDARNQVQCSIVEMAMDFIKDVVAYGLVEVAGRWFDRRRGSYDKILNFKEELMDQMKTPEMQNF